MQPTCTRLLTALSIAILPSMLHAQQVLAPLPSSPTRPVLASSPAAHPNWIAIPQRAISGNNTASSLNGRSPLLYEPKDSRGLLAGPGDSVGYTYYDFQTNGAMPDRIINWAAPVGPNSFLTSMVWMASTTPGPEYTDRGTHGAIALDQSGSRNWLPITFDIWRRIEPERTGFPDLDHFSDGSLIFSSHRVDGVDITYEDGGGTSNFTTIPVDGGENGLWARIAVGADDVAHLIWTYQNDNPEAGVLKYSRSTDKGRTWSFPSDVTGAGSMVGVNLRAVQGADAYAIAANGEHVVIWYYSQGVQIIQVRSRDNGATWLQEDAIIVSQAEYQRRYTTHENPDSIYYIDPDVSSDTATGYRTDTSYAPGSSMDLIVDADGRVHGVYAIFPTYITRYVLNDSDTLAPEFRGLISRVDYNYTDVGLIYFEQLDQNVSTSSIALPSGLTNDERFLQPRAFSHGFARWPQLGRNDAGHLFLVYTSGVPGDVVRATPNKDTMEHAYLYGHTYATWSNNSGRNWAESQNLTPNGVDAQFATLADRVDEELLIAYQTDSYPGDLLTSAGTGEPGDTNGSGLHPNITSNVQVMAIQASSLNPLGVGGETAPANAESVSVWPNPSNGSAQLSYTVALRGAVTISIVDQLGREVRHLVDMPDAAAGTYTATISSSGLPNGAYFVTLRSATGVSTTPLTVTR